MRRVELEKLPQYHLDYLGRFAQRKLDLFIKHIPAVVEKESEKLFSYMNEKAIGVKQNPFKQFSGAAWPALGTSYAQKKAKEGKNQGFWAYKGKLGTFLNSKSPKRYYKAPAIKVRGFKKGFRGNQRLDIEIIPWPNQNPSFPNDIYNRLFAKRKGSKLSNEDLRPIENPAKQYILSYRIVAKVRKEIKAIAGGKYGK